MTKGQFEKLCEDVLLPRIDDLLRKRIDLTHDLIEALARSSARIERQVGSTPDTKLDSMEI